MKQFHSFGWYAARIAPYLPEEAFRSVPSRLFGGLAYMLVLVSSIVTISLFDLHWLWDGLLSVVIGFCFAGNGEAKIKRRISALFCF